MERLGRRARVLLAAQRVQVFHDQHSITAGLAWLPAIDTALDAAVPRYELTGTPRLMIVLADRPPPEAGLALQARPAFRKKRRCARFHPRRRQQPQPGA